MSCIITDSVISRIRACGWSAVSCRMPRTSSTSSGRAIWRAERFTAMWNCGWFGNRVLQARRPCGRPPSSTQRPIGTMRPVSSASGMKSSGGTMPRTGWIQRIRASTPEMLPLVQLDDRLVVQDELAVLQRALQVGLQLQALQGRVVHRGLEDLVATLALLLGHVHRDVGVAQQLLGVARRRSPSATAMPTLARTKTSLPSSANGSSSICITRSATSTAWMPSPPSSSRIANSSPPRRAAVSAARRALLQTLARPRGGAGRRPRGPASR